VKDNPKRIDRETMRDSIQWSLLSLYPNVSSGLEDNDVPLSLWSSLHFHTSQRCVEVKMYT
jgi:hypothetical protein